MYMSDITAICQPQQLFQIVTDYRIRSSSRHIDGTYTSSRTLRLKSKQVVAITADDNEIGPFTDLFQTYYAT